jgi:hypothetical protein
VSAENWSSTSNIELTAMIIQNDLIHITRACILANEEYPKQYNTLVKTTNLA